MEAVLPPESAQIREPQFEDVRASGRVIRNEIGEGIEHDIYIAKNRAVGQKDKSHSEILHGCNT